MKLEADKIVQNILHTVSAIYSLHHVILYVGTSIFEEPTSCVFRVHLSTHVRRFAYVIRHHSAVHTFSWEMTLYFLNTTRYVPPDLTTN